jgi:hypothetical protein
MPGAKAPGIFRARRTSVFNSNPGRSVPEIDSLTGPPGNDRYS